MKFKKGQIVPRWTGLKISDRKAQHNLKFGADVSYEGGVFYIESEGSCFLAKTPMRKMKNGTFKKKIKIDISSVRINAERIDIDRGQCMGFNLIN
jgi:hypothetical protein